MKLRLTILALCLFLASLTSAEERLRLATFNCEFLTRNKIHVKYSFPFELEKEADLQLWTPQYREERFAESVRATARVLEEIDADVLGLTEVGPVGDVEALRSELKRLGLNYPYLLVCEKGESYTAQHVALLSRFPLTEPVLALGESEFYIPEPDDPETEKEATLPKALKAVVKSPLGSLHLYLVHLRSERGGHGSDMERISQASIVRRHSLPLLQAGQHVVVMGDLNDKRGQPALLRVRGLDDIYPDLLQTGHAGFFSRDKEDTRWTYKYKGEYQQIDHILLSVSLRDRLGKRGIRPRTYPMRGNIGTTHYPASDHRPWVVDLVW